MAATDANYITQLYMNMWAPTPSDTQRLTHHQRTELCASEAHSVLTDSSFATTLRFLSTARPSATLAASSSSAMARPQLRHAAPKKAYISCTLSRLPARGACTKSL